MAISLKIRRGNTAQNNLFIGNEGELSYDTQKKELRVHDGSKAGGNKVININDIIDAMFPDYSKKQAMSTPFTADKPGYALWNNSASGYPTINGVSIAGVGGNDAYNEGPAMLFLRAGDVLTFSVDVTQGGAAFYPCKGW